MAPLAIAVEGARAALGSATTHLLKGQVAAVAADLRRSGQLARARLLAIAAIRLARRPRLPVRHLAILKAARLLIATLGLPEVSLARCAAMKCRGKDLARSEALAAATRAAAVAPLCPLAPYAIPRHLRWALACLEDGTIARPAIVLRRGEQALPGGLLPPLLATGPVGPVLEDAIGIPQGANLAVARPHAFELADARLPAALGMAEHRPLPLLRATAARRGALRPALPLAKNAIRRRLRGVLAGGGLAQHALASLAVGASVAIDAALTRPLARAGRAGRPIAPTGEGAWLRREALVLRALLGLSQRATALLPVARRLARDAAATAAKALARHGRQPLRP
mmetsp:Transcript_36059/g.108976  ORF Transcript_36059/g.108976 Transcript_36059/m.108976 type:complete len:340 (-) Transcript_36059:2447-3466(-)